MWVLQDTSRYEMRGGTCVTRSRHARVIRHGGVVLTGATVQVVVFLPTNKDIDVCDGCLALAAEVSLAEVRP